VDLSPVAGKTGQCATTTRDVPSFRGVVVGHIGRRDRQVDLLVENIGTADDDLRAMGLLNEGPKGGLGLGGEVDGSGPRA